MTELSTTSSYTRSGPIKSSASVWGKTFAATGGTLLFVVSFLAWGFSGSRSIQEMEFALALNAVTFLPIAVTLVPRIKNKIRGVMILGALVVEVSVGYIILASAGIISAGAPSGPPIPIFGLVMLFVPFGLILFGGVLVLLSR